MKQLIFLIFTLAATVLYAQESRDILIGGKPHSSLKEVYSFEGNGWALVEFKGYTLLGNFSNKEYLFSLNINCSDVSKKSGFVIEYSNGYEDGGSRGIDFVSSGEKEYRIINFFVDGKEFKNPFKSNDKGAVSTFKEALKNGKVLKVKIFDNKEDYLSGEKIMKLNREIDFKLENGHLLDTLVTCK